MQMNAQQAKEKWLESRQRERTERKERKKRVHLSGSSGSSSPAWIDLGYKTKEDWLEVRRKERRRLRNSKKYQEHSKNGTTTSNPDIVTVKSAQLLLAEVEAEEVDKTLWGEFRTCAHWVEALRSGKFNDIKTTSSPAISRDDTNLQNELKTKNRLQEEQNKEAQQNRRVNSMIIRPTASLSASAPLRPAVTATFTTSAPQPTAVAPTESTPTNLASSAPATEPAKDVKEMTREEWLEMRKKQREERMKQYSATPVTPAASTSPKVVDKTVSQREKLIEERKKQRELMMLNAQSLLNKGI